jgi:hypothetical protein
MEVEKAAAVDGTAYTVVAPVYDGSNGSVSYLRLYNGTAGLSAYTVAVVNTKTGTIAGTVNLGIPGNASVQYPVNAAGGSPSIMQLAGVTAESGTAYALYLQNANSLAGYQHVTFNSTTSLFENASVCSTPLIQQQSTQNNGLVLTNVHTTALGGYPSVVTLHNYASTSVTVTLRLYNAGTGASLGQVNQTIAANAILSLTSSQLESLVGYSPTSMPHVNIVLSNITGGSLPLHVTHNINNDRLGGSINMSETCAMNAVQFIPSTTGYCGTVNVAGTGIPGFFTAVVGANRRIEGTAFGENSFDYIGTNFSGTLTGTSFSISSSKGTGSGTIQNGVFSGTFRTTEGATATISGSTNGCLS